MADVDINKFRASVVRDGSKPASPGFVVSEGQDPVDPSGSGQNHLPVTIAAAATGLSITESQVLGGAGTTSQYLRGDASLASFPDLTGYVPYTGANQTVNLNTQQLQAGHTTLTTNGSTETLTINHTSGSGKAINVTKGGAGEGLYVNKTSGSGNAATIVGTLEATTLVKTGGTSSQFLKADGSVDSTTYGTGTVTSVGLSSATSGVTIGSSPVTTSGTITLAIATASGSQNGLLSSTDWTTFNGKQNALTNPVTGTGTTNYLPKFTGASTIGNSQVFDNGTNVGIGTNTPGKKLDIVTNVSQDGIRITGSSNPRLTIIDSTNNVQFDVLTTDTEAVIRTDTNHPLHFTTNGVPRMYLNTSGNLGLGVTPSAWAAGGGNFQLKSGVNITWSGQDGYLSTNQYFNGSSSIYIANGYSNSYAQAGGSHYWYNAPFGTAGNSISFTQAMALTSGGNLLVGTTSDNGARLQVSGAATFSSSVTAGDGLIINDGNGIPIRIQDISAAITGQTAGYIGMSTSAFSGNNGDLVLYPRTSAASRILLMGGNVGIGTASNIFGKLSVEATGNHITLRAPGATAGKYWALDVTTANQFYLLNNTGSQFLTITDAGAATFSSSVTSGTHNINNLGVINLNSQNGFQLGADSFSGGFYIYDNTTGIYRFKIANAGAATFSSSVTAASYITSSDARLKKVISKDGDLAIYSRLDSENIHYGYIAQDMEKEYPNQVHTDDKGFLSLNYIEILVKKVNDLEKKIKQLEQ